MSTIDAIKEHVRQLSVVIGPRGSTTEEERKAADYAESVYREIGLSPLREHFTSAKSAWYPFALGTLLMLLAETVYWFFEFIGAVLASIIAVIALPSLILELSFRPNPFRWILPKGQSQNVSAAIEPTGEVKQVIVLVGHIDTHRMPISHRSLRWLSFFKRLTTTTFLSGVLMLVLFILSLFFDWVLLRMLTLLFAIPILLLFLMAVSADRTSFSSGANDNASGAAIVMGLAARLAEAPLNHTKVWAVNCGCEEVGSYGAAAWVDSHIDELDGAIYLTLDNVGGTEAGPCYLTKETLIIPFASDIDLVRLADQVSRDNHTLGAYSTEMRGAYTDGAIGIKAGLRCLTFVGYRRDGVIPNWHQPSDIFENVDWDVVKRTEEFVWLLIEALDGTAT